MILNDPDSGATATIDSRTPAVLLIHGDGTATYIPDNATPDIFTTQPPITRAVTTARLHAILTFLETPSDDC